MSEGDKIRHVALPIGNGTVMMGSDSLEAMGGVTVGNNFSLALQADSKEQADKFFQSTRSRWCGNLASGSRSLGRLLWHADRPVWHSVDD